MKRTAYLWIMLIVSGLGAVSCLNKEEMERLDDLEQRISKLEEAAGVVNNNSMALSAFLKEETIIVGFRQSEHSYELELSDGTVLIVTDGLNAPGIVPIIGIDGDGNWIMSVDNGETFSPVEGSVNSSSMTGQTPLVKVDKDGLWLVSTDGGRTYAHITGAGGKPLSAVNGIVTGNLNTFFEDVTYDSEKAELTIALKQGEDLVIPVIDTFYLNVLGMQETEVIFLNQTKEYKVELSDVKDALFQVPEGWAAVLTEEALQVTGPQGGTAGNYKVNIVITSPEGYIKHIELAFTLEAKMFDSENCQPYKDWQSRSDANVLLDFSYAGYDHGENAPAEAAALGYAVYDVTKYGAIPNDGKSDREAFLKCVEAATGVEFAESDKSLTLASKDKADAIVYFPEGEYILHTSDDDNVGSDSKIYSRTIQIRAGNFVLRGAGRDKTTLVMQDKNLPTNASVLYSSPLMIDFKHNSGLGDKINVPVTENAPKGAFAVKVADAAGLSEGSWVCLTVQNDNAEYVALELKDGNVVTGELSADHDIIKNGVKVFEYHQIKKIEGNVVTFHEPIHHEVDINYAPENKTGDAYNWCIMDYPHYENVGIEDLTFKGNAKNDFSHHGSWEDDGAYKPLGMTRLVNSWLRRVRFTSVSEACSVTNSANVSVYDVIFDGNRGHSSIRSQVSTRVFIGKTVDISNGPAVDGGSYMEGAGQYHAVGVSKPSIGTVLWRNVWGNDSCFESHATQPRATLIDCCRGGWMQSRQGGDENQVPNHLADLTVWNFEATTTSNADNWQWWNHSSKWWKFLPPVIVGFHGSAVTFDQTQTKLDYSNGIPVAPESLYEAQLKERLGAVPAWLNNLK
ncbi:MAG: DUF4955 domain-containing protein [Bacteroidales bacterium]|nr:DUF4955 domain-containing protein [Bacteroidales bacterium]